MNREEIIRMAREAGEAEGMAEFVFHPVIERFAALVASAERERIKQANAPEIERINAYIKEALAQREPVAWEQFYPEMGKPQLIPPQRTWVGLTEDEILSISADCASSHQHMDIHFARAIEAKLRSKNS